ncbi:guanine nucleotide exchange factor [Moesziomyces antarcticus T-34]|uniref:Guanine nucleotide exchange factor n=1 Tax=Pseudozyma antarctica (strain T-34) TaxID=1151754 RepID=M9LV11_PSEA3|nr:guanine nucleotide exchange factor [Moesziomyces antarcticus T-34]
MVSDQASRVSSSQREPQRGPEAIANFFGGRYSTDQGSVRAKNTESSLSSYAGSMRRSSSGTEFYSQAHSANGADGADESSAAGASNAPASPKPPRVYSSFSAAAAAASRSSVNKKSSQSSIPSNPAASPSIRQSPAMASPRISTSAFGGDVTSSSGVNADSEYASPSKAAKPSGFDVASVNQYTPGSLASTFPWLSSNPQSSSTHLVSRDRVLAPAQSSAQLQSHMDSPPNVSQYSKGKGFGWNPNDQHRAPPKSASRLRTTTNTPRSEMRDTKDSIGRGLGFKSTSELDLPERMRSQRKAALAPPRLSQDPIAISIEDELRPQPGVAKTDSAFSRLGRAFRRKSKTGSDLRVDLGSDAPPLPKTPRRMPSQMLATSQLDRLAPNASSTTSSLTADAVMQRHKRSVDINGARAGLQAPPKDAPQDSQSASKGSDHPSPSSQTKSRDATRNSADLLSSQVDGNRRNASFDSRPVEGATGRVGVQEDRAEEGPRSDQPRSLADASAAPADSRSNEAEAMLTGTNHRTHSDSAAEGSKSPEDWQQNRPAVDESKGAEDSQALDRSDDVQPGARAASAAEARPLSMESTSSSARRNSLVFLASAISMGAIAAEPQEAASAADAETSNIETDRSEKAFDRGPWTDTVASSVPAQSDTFVRSDNNASVPTSSEHHTSASMTRVQSGSSDRRRLEPKSAVRSDAVPSILSDFLSMDAALSAKDGNKRKAKEPTGSSRKAKSTTESSSALERTASANSDGKKSSYSTSPKSSRATKGVFMSPPAGPSMGGFVSPFYVAPLTSVDAGLANRATRPTGRRASASSRSTHSDDSKSVHSTTRRGSASQAPPAASQREAQEAPQSSRATEETVIKSQELASAEKARKVKSVGNLKASAPEQSQEAMPRSSTSKIPSASAVSDAPASRSHGVSAEGANAATQAAEENSNDSSLSRSQSISQRLLRRPKTSGAEAGLGSGRTTLAMHDAGLQSGSRRGSGPGRASLDESGRSGKPLSSSPTETDFEMLASSDLSATASKDTSASRTSRENGLAPRASNAWLKESPASGRRPSESSSGAITPSSSRIESSGGAAALFGNPTTRPRTSSLLPSFGFSRSRTGSSAGLEGTGKSAGTFGGSSRSASGGLWRDQADAGTRGGAADSSSQLQDVNGTTRSPRASSSSRPSFSRQLSSTTAGLAETESAQSSVKTEKKFSLSAYLPYDDEDAPEYADRIASTAPKTQLAAILASSPDAFYIDALHHFMTRFWFNGLPLDIALRKLLMDLHLPKETQQIDRVMEAFAKRYNECNSGLFASDDQPYILSFSLMMLHTDAFNKNAKNKMTKVDYLRNTGSSGVPTEILEYLYDNLTFTQFIYVEDEEGARRRPSEASGISTVGPALSSSLAAQGAAANARTKIDPYFLITQGRLGELRPDLEHLIPEDTPFSYTGTLPAFDVDRLNSAFLHAPSIEIVTTKPPSDPAAAANASAAAGEEEVVSLKVTKVGIVNRKDDVSDGGKKAASRKWKTSGLLLTGSQLLLFKDVVWINALQSQILDQVGHSLLCNGIPTDDPAAVDEVEGGVVISPRITYFRPDGVISLADAVAVKDHSYGKYDFVFRLLAAKGRQYLVQAQSEDDMNDWIHKINFCASFRTCNIKIRGLDLAPRAGSGTGLADPDSLDVGDPSNGRSGRGAVSRLSLSDSDRASRGMERDGSGRSTPVPDEAGDTSREASFRLSVDPMSRTSESDGPPRPASSASQRMSPASSALQKRAKARRELMLTKIAETEVQLERASTRLADEIRLARHFAILTPFLKSTRERIEMSAQPLAHRIRSLRLEVSKAESRCKMLRLDLAAGERVARALLPAVYLSASAMRSANRLPSSQVRTPQLLELGRLSESQAQFEDLFAPAASNGSAAGSSDAAAALAVANKVTKPASHQRNQMNLNAVTEQPADESPVMATRRELPAEDAADERGADVAASGGREQRPPSPAQSVASQSSAENQQGRERDRSRRRTHGADVPTTDEVPEDWDLSQVARPGTNRISLVDLPSPDELQEATGGRFRFGVRAAE